MAVFLGAVRTVRSSVCSLFTIPVPGLPRFSILGGSVAEPPQMGHVHALLNPCAQNQTWQRTPASLETAHLAADHLRSLDASR